MDKTKIIEVYITTLKITAEDPWLKDWIEYRSDSIFDSPQYLYLLGDFRPMHQWMLFRQLPPDYLTKKIMSTMQSIIAYGQQEPILIYRDNRVNTGHKRAAIHAYLEKKTIKAKIVEDNYKL